MKASRVSPGTETGGDAMVPPPGPAAGSDQGSAWARLRQAQTVAVTASAITRDAQELGSSNVLTIHQLENAAMMGDSVRGSPWVIMPTNPYKQAWDLLVLFVLGFSAVLVPFRVAFFTEYDELAGLTAWSVTELVMDFILLVDVVLTFFSAVEVDGVIVTDLRTIAWNYFRSWFALDVAASFPLSLAFPAVGQNLRGVRLLRLPRMLKLLKVLRLLRVMRVLRASRYARSIQRYVNLNPAVLRLVTFVLAFMLFAHMAACLWFLVADLEDFVPDSWVARYGILDSRMEVQYVSSLYYATTLLSTTGLGDIVPLLPSEQIYTICLEVAGITVISYLTSTITGLIGSFDARARRRRLKFEELERFMSAKRLTPALRSTMRDYFEMILASKSTVAVDEAKLLGELSGPLQTAVMFEVHETLINRFGFFKGKQAEFVRDVLKAASPLSFQHDRVIAREGMTGDALFLLTDGRVNFQSLQGTVYMQLPSGSVFGCISLLCTGRNVVSVHAVGFVRAYTLVRRDVERIMEDYPDVEAELLAMALARLRRIELLRGKTEAQRRRIGKGRFSEAAEAATDKAVSRALAEGAQGVAPMPASSRRLSAASAAKRDIADGFAAGSAQRVAILRHMADTRTFRRLSNSGGRIGPGTQAAGDGAHAGGAVQPGRAADVRDTKLAAAEAAVSRAMREAAAGDLAPPPPGQAQPMAPPTTGDDSEPPVSRAVLFLQSSGALKDGVATGGGDRKTRSRRPSRAGSAAAAGADGEGAGSGSRGAALPGAVEHSGPSEGGPDARKPRRRAARASAFWPSSMPPLLDPADKHDSLQAKSRSGGLLSIAHGGGSRRNSAGTAASRRGHGAFRQDLSRSKELELSRQTDSLIDRAMTTVDRAVQRKEKLVSRMAAERDRRQLTSRPVGSPSGDSGARLAFHSAAHGSPSAQVAAFPVRSGSKRLQERARGLRAKLDKRRKELHAVSAISRPMSSRWDMGKPQATPPLHAVKASPEPDAGASFIVDGPVGPLSPTDAALAARSRRSLAASAASMAHQHSEATLLAMQDMTAAMQSVANSISGLQAEQEAIVDLLIAVLADDGEGEDVTH